MKRYLLFAMDSYYPEGGWYDFRSAFDTLEEAEAAGMALVTPTTKQYEWGEYTSAERDWYHVVDTETMERV